MANLSLTFAELKTEIEKFLGTYNSGSPSSNSVTDAAFIVNRAYARYMSYYDWYLLYQRKVLDKVSGIYLY